MARRQRPWMRHIRWTVTVIVLGFVIEYVVLPEVASARKSIRLLGKVNVAYLLLAVALEVLALVSYAGLSRTVLYPRSPSRFRLLRINMATLAISHVLPGGTAPGTALSYRLLTDSGVPGSTAGFGLATQGVGSAVVLNAIFWLALVVSIPLHGFNPLYGIAAAAGVVLMAGFAGAVLLLTRGKSRAVGFIHAIATRLPFLRADAISDLLQGLADRLHELTDHPTLLRRALWWAAANWLFDAASLWVFLFAFGKALLPIDLLVAYGLANILAVIPITPGGLGVVEGVLIPTIVGFRTPKAIAILGVISYRLVNFWLPAAPGPLDRQFPELALETDPLHRLDASPAAVRAQRPRVGVVGEHQVEDLEQASLQACLAHRRQELDAAIQIALHQVRRTNEQPERASAGVGATEAEDPGVLQELPDDRPHRDRLRQPGDPWAQTAQPPHRQIDRHPGDGGRVERIDHRSVGQPVHLDHDPAGGARGRLFVDHCQDLPAQRHRRDEDLAIPGMAAEPGEVVEQVADVGTDLLVGSEQTQVLVGSRRLGVVVPGSDVAITADPVVFSA